MTLRHWLVAVPVGLMLFWAMLPFSLLVLWFVVCVTVFGEEDLVDRFFTSSYRK